MINALPLDPTHPHLSDTSGPDSPLFWVYMVGVVLSVFFVFRYALYSNWRSTLAGKAIMILGCSISIVMLYAAGSRLFEPPPTWRVIIGITLLGAVDVALINLNRVLVRYQGGFRRGRAHGTQIDRTVYERPHGEDRTPQVPRDSERR